MKLIEVHMREQGKLSLFHAGETSVKIHDIVIVESERGLDYGQVVTEPLEVPEEKNDAAEPVHRILRVATAGDLAQIEKNKKEVSQVFDTASGKIQERSLAMKLVSAEYAFDRSKIVFYFTAEGRVDFRELVRDLAHLFKARIELKQIGVRDEVRMFGGFGCCGRKLCCTAFLKDFEPVTIRMAKQQNMPLNPEKISGLCGRLMCCLGYEYETYKEFCKVLPKEGETIQTPEGKGRVISVHILKRSVMVELEDERKVEVSFQEEGQCPRHGKQPDKV